MRFQENPYSQELATIDSQIAERRKQIAKYKKEQEMFKVYAQVQLL